MSAYKIIEKYHHELSKPKLLFLIWLADKHPEGIMRSKINYPHLSDSYMEKSAIPDLMRSKAIKCQGLGTKHSKIIPNL